LRDGALLRDLLFMKLLKPLPLGELASVASTSLIIVGQCSKHLLKNGFVQPMMTEGVLCALEEYSANSLL
jgi:hypothetical protein